MDETTLFNKNNQTSNAQQSQPQQPTQQPAANPQSQPAPVQTQPSEQPQSSPPQQQGFESPLYQQPLYTDNPIPPAPPQNNAGSGGGGRSLSLPGSGLLLRIGAGIAGLLFIILIIFLVSRLFAGGSSSNQKVTLTYWGLWEDKNTMQVAINDYEKQHPNVTINYIEQSPSDYLARLQTHIHENASDAPDIFRFHNTWTSTLVSGSNAVLAPIPANVMTPTDFEKTFYPVAAHDLIKNGAIYGIPLEVDTLAMFVNAQIFQAAGLKPPTDFLNEFGDDARHLTVKDSNGNIVTAGAGMGDYNSITHAPDIIAMLLAQDHGGVDFSNLGNESDKVNEVLAYYTQYGQGDGATWSDTLGKSIDAFAAGRLAIFFGYSWDVPLIEHANPKLQFKIVKVPSLPNVTNTTVASYWVEGVSINSKHQKEAMDFLKFLSQKSTEQELYTQESKERPFGEPYARMDLASSLQSNPLVYPFVEQGKTATSSYFAADTGNDNGINGRANSLLQNAVNSILNTNNPTSAQSAAQTLTQNITPIIQQYGY